MVLYQQYPSNFSFCTNKLRKASINSKHLSKPKAVFYLVQFSDQIRKRKKKKKKNKAHFEKYIYFFSKKVFLIYQEMELPSPRIKKLIKSQEPNLKARKVVKAALKKFITSFQKKYFVF